MSDESMTEEQLEWLVSTKNIVIQFEKSGHRVAVGLPFALEICDNSWWLCCPQGKFRLCVDARVLFGRNGESGNLGWVSILESYRSFLMFRENDEAVRNTPIPERISPQNIDWLLEFLRHCALVVVSDDPQLPAMPPETRATVPSKQGPALTRIKQLIRRRGARRLQPRR